MTKETSDEEVDRIMDNARNISKKMMRNVKGENGLEVIYACMKITTFIISQQFNDKEVAYQFMAELFDVGDEMLKDYEASGAAAWNKK
jgi:hypothetical protein